MSGRPRHLQALRPGMEPIARPDGDSPDLGDLVIVLLASTLSGLRERLVTDGFDRAAGLVEDLVEVTDGYLTGTS